MFSQFFTHHAPHCPVRNSSSLGGCKGLAAMTAFSLAFFALPRNTLAQAPSTKSPPVVINHPTPVLNLPIQGLILQHSGQFQARGTISSINQKQNKVILKTPNGGHFTINQITQSSGASGSKLSIGMNVLVTGTIDRHGNLNAINCVLQNSTVSSVTIMGSVIAIDPASSTFSLIDTNNDLFVINTSPSSLANLQLNNLYTVQGSATTDGTVTAQKISVSQGRSADTAVSLTGIIQTYNPDSSTLTLKTASDTIYTISLTDQTQIAADDYATAILDSGISIKLQALRHSDGSYSAVSITINNQPSG